MKVNISDRFRRALTDEATAKGISVPELIDRLLSATYEATEANNPTINERRQAFKRKIWDYAKDKQDKYPIWLLKEFFDHWTQLNDNGRKMYFEMEKRWSTGGRLATFRKNSLRWDKEKWKKEEPVVYKPSRRVRQKGDDYQYPNIDYSKFKMS